MRITEALHEVRRRHDLSTRGELLVIEFSNPLAQQAFMDAIETDLGSGWALRRSCREQGIPDMFNGIELRVKPPQPTMAGVGFWNEAA